MEHSGPSLLARGTEIGGYRIGSLVSRGGMGVVYRATHVALNRIYALKVLAPELSHDEKFRERFKREMRLAASLHHPNIVAIHYAGDDDGQLFFVMDFIQGSDLREVLENTGAIEPERAVALLMQLASALDCAHGRGLVHRDVKPANILITVRDGEEWVYLTDFGIARRSDTIGGLTAQGAIVGTVDYMAPEQVNGFPTDARTDIYALGCVFFQMLTGRVPYERENSIAKLFAHVHDAPPSIEGELAQLYPTFGAVIEKAMAKDPADRYTSAGDFARDSEAALSGQRYTGPQTRVATGEAMPAEEHHSPVETTPSAPPPAATEPSAAPPGPPPAATEPSAPPPGPPPAATEPSAPPPEPPSAATSPSAPSPEPSPVAPQPLSGAETVAAAAADPSGPPPAPRPRSRYRRPAAGVVALLAAAAVAVILITSGGSSGGGSPSKPAGTPFAADGKPVPTNHVEGASGTAAISLHGNVITATIVTNGLLKGAPHLIHIHAGGQGLCPPASVASEHGGHLSISTTDGLKFYGPPVVSLTTTGDTSASSNVSFDRYPATGAIRYKRTLTIPAGIADAIRANNAVFVVHGVDYNHNGIYDDVLDRSDLNPKFPGEATAPALCGPLHPVQNAQVPGATTFTASLGLTRLPIPVSGSLTPAERFWLLCHLPQTAASPAARRHAGGWLATAT